MSKERGKPRNVEKKKLPLLHRTMLGNSKHEKWKAMCAIRDYLKMNLRIVEEEIEEICNEK